MSTGIGHYPIFGTDIVVIIGTTALILFIFVASIKSINRLVLKKRDKNISPYWHHWIANLCNSFSYNTCCNTIYLINK
jgi:hypothetical protein